MGKDAQGSDRRMGDAFAVLLGEGAMIESRAEEAVCFRVTEDRVKALVERCRDPAFAHSLESDIIGSEPDTLGLLAYLDASGIVCQFVSDDRAGWVVQDSHMGSESTAVRINGVPEIPGLTWEILPPQETVQP